MSGLVNSSSGNVDPIPVISSAGRHEGMCAQPWATVGHVLPMLRNFLPFEGLQILSEVIQAWQYEPL